MKISAVLLFFCLVLLTFVSYAAAYNSGYGKVVETKVWPTYIDIYLDVESTCDNASNRTRYVLDKTESAMYSTLLAAMTAKLVANLNYDCRGDGIAAIYGVRVKPQS
jgi:hypothetical protein